MIKLILKNTTCPIIVSHINNQDWMITEFTLNLGFPNLSQQPGKASESWRNVALQDLTYKPPVWSDVYYVMLTFTTISFCVFPVELVDTWLKCEISKGLPTFPFTECFCDRTGQKKSNLTHSAALRPLSYHLDALFFHWSESGKASFRDWEKKHERHERPKSFDNVNSLTQHLFFLQLLS